MQTARAIMRGPPPPPAPLDLCASEHVRGARSFGVDFEGGLYVSAGRVVDRRFVPLARGDAVVHQSDLLHGVDVQG